MKALRVALMIAPMMLLSGCCVGLGKYCSDPERTVPYGTYNITDSYIDTPDEGVVNFNSDTLVVQYTDENGSVWEVEYRVCSNDNGTSNYDDERDNFQLCP